MDELEQQLVLIQQIESEVEEAEIRHLIRRG